MITYPTMIEGQWNLVATGISSGSLDNLNGEYSYYETHVLTTEDVPEASVKDKSPKLFDYTNKELIESSYSLDLYIYPERVNGEGETIENALRMDA